MNIERYLSTRVRVYGNLSKPMSLKSPSHLAFIRKQKCIVTGSCSEPHHIQTKRRGVNDYLTVPLSHDSHMRLHNMGMESFQYDCGIDLKDALIAKLIERIMELEASVRNHTR